MAAAYRVLPVLGAASAGLLAALSIVNSLNLYNDVRGQDLRDISLTPSSARGSCVWQPTPQAVRDFLGQTEEEARFRCLSDPRRFEALAMLSLHAARFALTNSSLDPSIKILIEQHYLNIVRPAALGSTAVHSFYFNALYDVLTNLDFVNIPLPSCDAIYFDVASPQAPACNTPPAFPTVICDPSNAPIAPIALNRNVPQCARQRTMDHMYYLCLQQFQYGLSEPNPDALNLYDFTRPFTPDLILYEDELGFNASTTALQKSDVWVGLRFGIYVAYLVPASLLNGMLLFDAVLVAFWESTVRLRYTEIASSGGPGVKATKLMNQYVTSKSFRTLRAGLVGFQWVVVIVLTMVFQSLTFGFNGTLFPRFHCQPGSGEGWQSDVDNVWTTYTSIFMSLGSIVAHPISVFFHNSIALRREENAQIRARVGTNARGKETFSSKVTRRSINFVLVFGIVILLFDAICISVALGIEWARSITQPAFTSYPTLKYENLLFESGSSFSSIALANGGMVALLIGRQLFGGAGYVFVVIFILWSAAGLVTLIPLVGVDSVRYAFNNLADVFSEDNVDLSDGSDVHAGLRPWVYTYSKDQRHFALYTGVGLVAISFLIVFGYWFYRLISTGSFVGNERDGYSTVPVPDTVREVLNSDEENFAQAASAATEEMRSLLVLPAAGAAVCSDCDADGDAAEGALPPLLRLSDTQRRKGQAAICAN
jgi:hypothetical protein